MKKFDLIENRSILYQFISKITIVDSILIVEIRINDIRRSNWDFRFGSTTLIRFHSGTLIALAYIHPSFDPVPYFFAQKRATGKLLHKIAPKWYKWQDRLRTGFYKTFFWLFWLFLTFLTFQLFQLFFNFFRPMSTNFFSNPFFWLL